MNQSTVQKLFYFQKYTCENLALFTSASKALAVVITVQVLLADPECAVTHLLRYLLKICVESEVFSGRNQSNGCAVAWVTIARDSKSEYPFHPVGNSTGFVQDTYGVKYAQVYPI